MNFVHLSHILKTIQKDFELALSDFLWDPIFQSPGNIYLKSEKQKLKKKWKKIAPLFSRLKSIRGKYGFGLWFKRDYNGFIIKYYTTILYYNMAQEIQASFKEHEVFIRQFLFENYSENYDTIARYIYKRNFLYYLNYPKKFLALVENKISPELKWMLEIERNSLVNFDFDAKNFYFYFIGKWEKLMYIVVKWVGIVLSNLKIPKKWVISEKSIEIFYQKVSPWDILLTRRSFATTNIYIPGFWKHMAMYMGTWKYLKRHFARLLPDQELLDDTHYVIESLRQWVIIRPFKQYIRWVDYLWVFRWDFSKKKIQSAIIEVLWWLQYGYDYLFNFYSDRSFVCSELITKSYLKDSPKDEWLTIHLKHVPGWLTYPPNSFVKKVSDEFDTPHQEVIPILFIDAHIIKWKSFIASNKELLQSHTRSKFSFLLK